MITIEAPRPWANATNCVSVVIDGDCVIASCGEVGKGVPLTVYYSNYDEIHLAMMVKNRLWSLGYHNAEIKRKRGRPRRTSRPIKYTTIAAWGE